MSQFQKDYEKYLQSWTGAHGSVSGNQYVKNVEEAIHHSTKIFEEFMKSNENKGIDFLKGDIAEFWHSETLKINSAVKLDKYISSNVPRNTCPIDISYSDSQNHYNAQLKYYKTASGSAKEISNAKFDGLQKIVPSDQLEEVREFATRQAKRNIEIRPDQAERYEDTALNATDRLKVGRSESTPLSEKEAKNLAQDLKNKNYDPKDYGLDTQSIIKYSDIARQSGEAALQAAIIGAVLKAGPMLYDIISEAVKNGEIDLEKLKIHGGEMAKDAPWNGLRAGIASFLTASCNAGLLGEAMKNVTPSVIGATTVIAVNSIRNGILLYKGEISGAEYAERCLRDSIIISFGVFGAVIGQAIIPLPILGGLLGNFIGGLVGTIVYKQGNQLLMAIAIENGWTFFNFVDQNYTVPENVLKRAGFDLFDTNTFDRSSFNISSFQVGTFFKNSINIFPVKRGVIGIRQVGYY